MDDAQTPSAEEAAIDGAMTYQLEHFRSARPPCQGVRMPDGVLLRHAQSRSLYFFLRTVVENGSIRTQVYASDSPYDRQKAAIGLVSTPMFAPRADYAQLEKVEGLIRDWVEFVNEQPDSGREFQSFTLSGER